ncbi:sigma-70 family RNA polymerase sigma factor [Salsipaludibacter albus]|uniref:sigma-70 family RNA polymerase sigma factor n=1 Tax=Salsipaludibacter albus TaxID=2849650 RepID=UPI001EE41387|nr:sigma-70 family RNA polymerase sigma factor [Salsipaludibacter albus]
MVDHDQATLLSELFERAASRGYMLLSELTELHDPLLHPDDWVEDTAQRARDLGMQVIDDLVEDSERPEVNPLSASADSVRQYLNEIGRTELLTAEEEVDLAKRYQAGLHAARVLGARQDLNARERAQLRLIMRQGRRAKDHMIRANLRLVVSVARKFRGRGVDLLALIQEGNLGLIRGVEKFDHTKGYKFSTYATWWIRQALQRGLANTGRTVRLPVHVHELMGKIRYAEFALLQVLGRDPTEEEIADELGLTVDRLREVKIAAQDVASLDKPIGEDGDATMGELVADDDALDPAVSATATMARHEVQRALSALTDRERTVLMLRYGLMDGEEHTLEDIGSQFGLTRERIRQIEKKTLTKLRHPSRGFQLRGLLDSVEVSR